MSYCGHVLPFVHEDKEENASNNAATANQSSTTTNDDTYKEAYLNASTFCDCFVLVLKDVMG
eukprot:CAMPEP_0119331230 /NCGR_PEP_ID=MMETSP1333-20130426/80160_1 /TAXON_ID=418940 /ORGANISM="Scyphosphaera apsteinii, Strain RCC1455" /LENGTH=61 /DNA_ID=CAMNT_0007340781 /DNA_START=596 /DNA_END=781 /DNA_ORIENTATION=-